MTVEVGTNPLLKYGALTVAMVVSVGVGVSLLRGHNQEQQVSTLNAENGNGPTVKVDKAQTRLGGEADTTKTTMETLASSVSALQGQVLALTTGQASRNDKQLDEVKKQQEEKSKQEQAETKAKIDELNQQIQSLKEALNNKGSQGSQGSPELPQPENSSTNRASGSTTQGDLQSTAERQRNNKSFGLQGDEQPATGKGFTLSDVPNLMDPRNKSSKSSGTAVSGNLIESDGDIDWIQPSDARKVTDPETHKEVVSLPTFKGSKYNHPVSANSVDSQLDSTPGDKDKKSSLVPVYTIPSGATLLGVTSATALIGRIPMNNSVTSPYPFQIVVGEKNLATNGIRIPNLKGMVLNGTATGDYTLRCVNGQINSVTYTFTDGTIRTVSGGGNGGSGNSGSSSSGNSTANGPQQSPTGSTGGMGYITDNQGVPCVSGEYITNIGEYLAQTMAINGAAGAASAFAQGQESVTTNSTTGSSTSVISGGSSAMKYMAAKGLGTGVESGATVLAQRQQGAYDAVYVQPGAKLEVRITQQLEIDYDKKGRKVSHVQTASLYGSNRGLD